MLTTKLCTSKNKLRKWLEFVCICENGKTALAIMPFSPKQHIAQCLLLLFKRRCGRKQTMVQRFCKEAYCCIKGVSIVYHLFCSNHNVYFHSTERKSTAGTSCKALGVGVKALAVVFQIQANARPVEIGHEGLPKSKGFSLLRDGTARI